MNTTQMQYRAFVCVVVAATLIALAPIAVAGIRGQSLPAGLIEIADKSVVAFAGLLGAIGALLFRANAADHVRAENTARAIDLAGKTLDATPAGQPKGTPDDPVSVEEVQ